MEISSLIVTHQARIRCYLNNYKNKKIHRVMNGCIIKIIRKFENDKWIESGQLVYSGQIDEEKKGYIYYSTDPSILEGQMKLVENKGYYLTKFDFENRLLDMNDMSSHDKNKIYIFYLTRHGQATHNILKGIMKASSSKDTDLTQMGREQAELTGKNLLNYLKDSNSSMITNLFVSDMKRTRQTLANMYKGILEMKESSNDLIVGINDSSNIIEVKVLPCSHELAYVKNSKCDGVSKITANENKMNCSIQDSKCKIEVVPNSSNQLSVNWENYVKFYNGKTRGAIINMNKSRCRDTDMITLAVKDIEDNTNIPSAEAEIMKKTPPMAYAVMGVSKQGGRRRRTKKNKQKSGKKSGKKSNKKSKKYLKKTKKQLRKK